MDWVSLLTFFKKIFIAQQFTCLEMKNIKDHMITRTIVLSHFHDPELYTIPSCT